MTILWNITCKCAWKITKIVATRCQILRPKCTKSDFGWRSAQTPLGELTALPRPLSWIWGGGGWPSPSEILNTPLVGHTTRLTDDFSVQSSTRICYAAFRIRSRIILYASSASSVFGRMTNSSASCFCLLHFSSKWRSLCLWCRRAFAGIFALSYPRHSAWLYFCSLAFFGLNENDNEWWW